MLFSICLNFSQFQPDITYKSVAYKKKRVLISVASKVDFDFFKELRTLKPAINTAGGLGACKPPNGYRAETCSEMGQTLQKFF